MATTVPAGPTARHPAELLDTGDLAVLRAELDRGRVSAVALATESLRRLAEAGRRFGAVAYLLPERALAEARALRGGALRGIPYGAKDLFAARGGPTTWGVPSLAAQRFDRDAEPVRRLAGAGAVLVAKLTTTGLGAAGHPRIAGASLHGPARNPWDPDRYAGGSSSGPAIAVATGAVPFALGTETGGSVVLPAANCGVTGFRPTFGLVDRTGVMPLSGSLDKVGVLARSAATCAEVLGALAEDVAPGGAVGRLRVGVLDADLAGVADHTRAALRAGLRRFTAVAGSATPVDMNLGADPRPAVVMIMLAEAAHAHRDLLLGEDVVLADPGQLATLRGGLDLHAVDYLAARSVAGTVSDRLRAMFDTVDLIVAPSTSDTAQPLAAPRHVPTGTPAETLLAAANLAGLPGISVPVGLAADGLPVALHVIGPPHADGLVLAAATAFQRDVTYPSWTERGNAL